MISSRLGRVSCRITRAGAALESGRPLRFRSLRVRAEADAKAGSRSGTQVVTAVGTKLLKQAALAARGPVFVIGEHCCSRPGSNAAPQA